jgi:hypothetical protein
MTKEQIRKIIENAYDRKLELLADHHQDTASEQDDGGENQEWEYDEAARNESPAIQLAVDLAVAEGVEFDTADVELTNGKVAIWLESCGELVLTVKYPPQPPKEVEQPSKEVKSSRTESQEPCDDINPSRPK